MQPTYKNKVWVIIDGGEAEKEIIDRLKENYSEWSEDHFSQFIEHDFEKYYPEEFQEKVAKVLVIQDRKKKGNSKQALLEKVETWIKQDDNAAKSAFETSAAEVIGKLKTVELAVKNDVS